MKEERIAITVRIPKELMQQLKEFKNGAASLNDLVVKALEREVRMRYAREIGKKMDQEREETRRLHGVLSDSTPLIRDLREGIGRRD